ncbi:GGDEF domain-containing protein [Mycolicibacterium stellerae]|uniref:GGDEF domain-containing protein n=1 Tax=Mycolicibacterium stellerae TaxID=2358193 RepID=UPI001F266BB5|nr:GGDEF domain-containing protein [Mycolicibacterium stellerae]
MFGRLVRDWWREPVDYAAQVQYFTKRSMADAIRVMIGAGTGIVAVVSLAIQLPSASSDSIASHVVAALFAILTIFWACIWCCRPWPSRRWSIGFIVSCDIGIAVVALQDTNWLRAFFGFNAFALIGVYLMFFDGPKVLSLHTVWILVSTTVFAVHVGGGDFDGVAFAAKTLMATAGVVATPLGIQFGIWTLRNDANVSVTDPLTGLLNRRGLHLHVGDLVRDGHSKDAQLLVMVVDLDRFKGINDTFGHAVGDEVLIRSARRIKSAVRGSSLVARVGGEEFVIVELTDPGHTERITERVRSAVGAPADHAPITASVGVASVALATFAAPGIDPAALLDTIVGHADHAMFDAKRHGGNSTIHIQPADSDG